MLLVSTLFAIFSTSIQMFTLYRQGRAETLETFVSIETSFLASIEDALWRSDESQIGLLLDGVLAKNAVRHVSLTTSNQGTWTRGDQTSDNLKSKLYHFNRMTPKNGPITFGTMEVGITFSHVWFQVQQQFKTTLLTNLAKTLAVGMAMLMIFDRLAAQRLRRLANQVVKTSWRDVTSKVTLERGNEVFPDEIDNIVDALEVVRSDACYAYARLDQEKTRADALNTSLRAANQEQSELTTALSHDLITPVNTLQMLLSEHVHLQKLQEGEQTSEQTELLADIGETVDRMRAQIQSVVQYSTLLSTAHTSEILDLDDVVDGCLTTLADVITDETSIIRRAKLGKMSGHPYEIKVLMYELLKNAVSYTAPDRRLRLEIMPLETCDPDVSGFEIKDNGCGIADEYISTAFGLFKRLHTYVDVPGAGMGLALCRRVVERHGGSIELKSKADDGTCVTVTFPKGGQI
ncbi:MAG: ATP-binding protein [Aliishimia sp.]